MQSRVVDIVDPERNESFVSQIQEHFRAKIRRGDLRPGEKIPSINCLSERTGVSVGVVKQAIATLSTEGYLRSHRGRGVYVAEPRLARQNIAIVLPSLDTEQMPLLIRGVKRALNSGSSRLVVQAADFDFDEEMDMLTNLDTSFIAGAVIYPPPLTSYCKPLEELERRGLPFVLVNTFFDSLSAHTVSSDRFMMGRLAFEELIRHGHRKIGVVDHDGDASSVQQIRLGADQALQGVGLRYAGLPHAIVDIKRLDMARPWAHGQAAAERLLREHPDITAITGINDYISMGAFRAAKALGKRVPDDISVIALGDLTAFETTEPSLTSVDQNHQVMGHMAAERLLAMLSDPSAMNSGTENPHIRIEPTLRRRNSVARISA